MELKQLDIIALKHVLFEKTKALNQRLLNGADWKTVLEERRDVIEINAELYRRLNQKEAIQHPAAHPSR